VNVFNWLRKLWHDAPPTRGYMHVEGQETRPLDPGQGAESAARGYVHIEEQQTRDLDPAASATNQHVSIPGAQFKAFGDPAKAAELAARAGEGTPIPFGRWVWMELPWELKERFLGYVYLDPEAGASAKGGPESASQIAELPTYTVRLPMPLPIQLLTPEEISGRALPFTPVWLHYYGPQPDPEAWATSTRFSH
jgi:hypothetical protein